MNNIHLSISEAAIFLGIKKSTLYKLTHKRSIPFYKPGGKLIFFLKCDLDNYLMINRFDSKDELEKNYLNNLKDLK